MLAWLGAWADSVWNWAVIVLFLVLACLETFRPARRTDSSASQRWLTNLSLFAVNTSLIDVLLPAAIATLLAAHFSLMPGLFGFLGKWAGDCWVLLAGMLLLDLYAYTIHRVQHRLFILWRFHVVHHAEMDMDASTTLRHHPIEVLISSMISAVVFVVLGLPEWVFPIYALVGIIISLIQHMNARTPQRLDHALQWVLVTPGMHQIHHSVEAEDYAANFGTVLSIWDRMFGTYRKEPVAGRDALSFGVPPFTTAEYARPRWAWMMPFALRRPAQHAASGSHAD